jgi:Tol biopolymer transport system component/tRNA A-37 threonylcarbamoyl transferase component Bud32
MNENRSAHFKIQEKIGEGGMGVVYRAVDSRLGRDVALKILPEAFTADPERLARFRREAQLLASLNHPHIATIYGLEEVDGSQALVLELVPGPTLEDRVRGRAIPVPEALSVAGQIAEALESAHERGIVHRDLKPANVKLTADGSVKLLDFGLAKALEGDPASSDSQVLSQSPTISANMTGANVILGTAAYMSPEQARGQAVDRRADIWAFGVILYEMLTGSRLFTGETVSDTLAAVLKTDPDWERLPGDTPPALRRLLRRCLRRDPRERLRDVGDAWLVIEEVLRGGIEAEEPGVSAPPVSRRLPMVLGTVAVAAVAVAAAAWLVRPKATDLPHRVFEIPVADLSGQVGVGSSVALSPSGRSVAYTSRGRVWIRELDNLTPREVSHSEDGAAPFWSPDGTWLAFMADTRLLKVRAAGGEPEVVCELEERGNAASGGAWFEDGRIVFCTGYGGLMEVSANGGDPHALLEPDQEKEQDFHDVTALPDDRGVLFITHRSEGYDTVESYSDGTRRLVVRVPGQSLSDPVYSATGHVLFQRGPGTPGVWAVPFDLGGLEPVGEPFLVVQEGAVPSVSAGGTLIYVRAKGTGLDQLVWRDREGKTVATLGPPQRVFPAPALSPDGNRVVVRISDNDSPDLWILDAARDTRTRLSFEEGAKDFPSWSSDGRWIYYQFGRAAADLALQVRRSDGTGGPRKLGVGVMPSVSRDGRFLIYAGPNGGQTDIQYVALKDDETADGEPKTFLSTPRYEFWPRLSPDGRYLLYVSSESGKDEIYLKEFPGGEGKWQVSVHGGDWPHWRGDGGEIYYVTGNRMMAVPVSTKDGLRLGNPTELFTFKSSGVWLPFDWPDGFDVTADGRRFIMVEAVEQKTGEGPEPGLVVVQNWFAPFRNAGS